MTRLEEDPVEVTRVDVCFVVIYDWFNFEIRGFFVK
jgi:hypothetical protein